MFLLPIWISEHGQGMGNLDKDIARSESLRLPHECVRKRRTEVGCAPALQTEDPEAEQADWMYTPGSPSFSKPFYLIIHLFFDVENDCLLCTQFYTPFNQQCILQLVHLSSDHNYRFDDFHFVPRLHTSSPFQGGQQCIPTSQGWSVNQQDIHVFRDGLRSNHRANAAGQIGTFPQAGVKNTRKLETTT